MDIIIIIVLQQLLKAVFVLNVIQVVVVVQVLLPLNVQVVPHFKAITYF